MERQVRSFTTVTGNIQTVDRDEWKRLVEPCATRNLRQAAAATHTHTHTLGINSIQIQTTIFGSLQNLCSKAPIRINYFNHSVYHNDVYDF